LNLDNTPLQLEVKQTQGFKQFTVPPGSLWVSPSADPITLRLNSKLRYLRVAIDPLHLGRLINPLPEDVAPVRLRRTYAVRSPQIAHLMLALRAEADEQNPGGLAAIEGLTLYGPSVDRPRTPTLSFTLQGHSTNDIARALAKKGVFVSNGDFYAMTVIERIGQAADGVVRVGCSCYTTEEEVDRVIEGVREIARGK
jgi:hypothetical protein